MFLVSILSLRIIGLYLFDVHLPANRGVRLPPLLPAVAMGVIYLITGLRHPAAGLPRARRSPRCSPPAR